MHITLHRVYLPLILVAISLWASRVHATVTNQDFIGTFDGSITSTFTCFDPNESGTKNGNWTVTSTNLNGNNYDFTGSNNATLDGSTTLFDGTATISGNTASSSGNLFFSDGIVFGNFTSTVTFSDSNNFTAMVSGAFNSPGGGCLFSSSITASRVTGDEIINPDIAPSNTLTDEVILNTQITTITTDLNSRINAALRGTGRGVKRTANGLFYDAQSSGLNAGDGLGAYGAWASYSYSDYENDFTFTAFDGDTHTVFAGFDIAPWENTLFGIAVGYEFTDIDTTFNGGNQETDGFTIAPYFGAILSDIWSIDFSFGYSNLDTDQYRIDPALGTVITSSPDSERWFGSLNLNALITRGNWIIGGRMGTLYANSDQDTFTESSGTVIASSERELGQWNLGADVAYSYGNFEPYARASYQHDFNQTEITLIGVNRQPSDDHDDVLVGAGIRYFNSNNISGSIEWYKRIFRNDFDEDVFSISIRADF